MTFYILIPLGVFQDYRTAYFEKTGEGIPEDSPFDGSNYLVTSSRATLTQINELAADFPDVQFSDEPPEFEPVWFEGGPE